MLFTDYLLIIVIIGLALAIYLMLRKKPQDTQKDDKSLLMLQEQLNHLRQTLDTKLSESTGHMQKQFSQSAKIIEDVTDKLAKLDSTNIRA